jgi:hypothetical protein
VVGENARWGTGEEGDPICVPRMLSRPSIGGFAVQIGPARETHGPSKFWAENFIRHGPYAHKK